MGLKPPSAVSEMRCRPDAARVTRSTEPPMASPSISGVRVLFTRMVCTISEGIRSICTLRLSPSAEGMRLPLSVTEFNSEARPRTMMLRASPWSFCMVMPGTRFSASPMLESGKRPTWSAEITLVTLRLVFCWLNALACPRAWSPMTTTSFNTFESSCIRNSITELPPSFTVTF